MAVFLPILILGLIVIGLLYFATFRYSRRRLYEFSKLVPGMPEIPLLGNAHQFAGSTKDILHSIKKICGICNSNYGIAKVWLGPRLYIALTDPPAVETVLNTEMKKDAVYDLMVGWLGNGLVSGPVSIWKRHRKILAPTFGTKILHSFVDIFAEQSEILVQKMSAEVGKGQFDVFKYISLCTLDIICESAMGLKVQAQDNKNASYIKAGVREMSLICRRMFQIWLQPQFIFKLTSYAKQEKIDISTLHTFTDTVVKRKKEEFKIQQEMKKKNIEYNLEDRPKIKAFLEWMIELSETGDKFSDEELREEVDTMTIAGNDTSAHVSSFVLTVLAFLPEVQQKVVDELRRIYGDSKRRLVKDDLREMEYLERVIKETLRLFPIAPIVVRQLTQDVKLEKLTLPAGAGIVIAVYGLHRDKKVWGENADEFDPDRFLPENSANRHPCSYIPFSAGPRNCIGKHYAMLSLKSIISTVLRSYKLNTTADYRNRQLGVEILLKPVNGHLISIEHRDKL